MKTAIFTILVFILGFHLANTKISFKPFSINFETPYYSFAVLFLVLSISLFQLQSEKQGFKRGVKTGAEKTFELIKKKNFKTNIISEK